MEWISTAYWICLLVGILYTVGTLLLGGIADFAGHGGGFGVPHGDFSHDYGVGGHGGYGETNGSPFEGGEIIFSPFSPLVVAFFLTCFGAAGIVMTRFLHAGVIISLPTAIAFAVALAWALVVLGNRFLGGMQVSSEIRLHTLIGAEAEVTVAIPAMGVGEIAYVAMGSRNVAPARSDDQTPIPRFKAVRITRIVGNFFFVRAVADELLDTPESTTPSAASSEVL